MTAVNTIAQTQTIGAMPDDWSRALSFGQFDPALGTLTGITILLDGTIAGTVSVENLPMWRKARRSRHPARFRCWGLAGCISKACRCPRRPTRSI